MDPTHLLSLTGTVELRDPSGTPDVFGDDVPDETTKTFACWLHQTARAENTTAGDVQSQTWTLYLESAAAGVVDGSSAITINGTAYEFDGPPWPALNPRDQQVVYVEATVRRVT